MAKNGICRWLLFAGIGVVNCAPVSAQSIGERLAGLFARDGNVAGSVSESDAAAGIREALAQSTRNAVERLGRTDGFLADELVRIAIPKSLHKVAKLARRFGAGDSVDALELAMNRAAEQAVPAAADIFADAIRQMRVQDAIAIVRGGEDAGTQYFRRVSEQRLYDAFLPIVRKATAQNQVTQKYKALASGKAGALALQLVAGEAVDLDAYITQKALDGVFHYVAAEERAIRRDPLQRSSALLKKVFGG